MSRCIQIGENAIVSASPNPMVGCCIVHNNTIIGEGYTSKYGSHHAEVNAINSVKNKDLLIESSLYVTLEPCSHFGKTPPCSDLILKHKIPKVYIGMQDPNHKVAGKGIKRLEKNGVNVTVGILLNKCKEHHKIFLTNIEKERPYILLKWAESKDGFIAPMYKKKSKSFNISNKYSRQTVHKLRSIYDCILVGSNTIKEDNPNLNNREWSGKSPIVVVINKENDLDKKHNIFNKKLNPIIIDKNCIDFDKKIANQLCEFLKKKKITSVLVEGGTKTINSFIDENFWDEIRIYKSSFNIYEGIKSPELNLNKNSEIDIDDDNLSIYFNIN